MLSTEVNLTGEERGSEEQAEMWVPAPRVLPPVSPALVFHVNLGVEEVSYPEQRGWEGLSGPLRWSGQRTLSPSFSARDTGVSEEGCGPASSVAALAPSSQRQRRCVSLFQEHRVKALRDPRV